MEKIVFQLKFTKSSQIVPENHAVIMIKSTNIILIFKGKVKHFISKERTLSGASITPSVIYTRYIVLQKSSWKRSVETQYFVGEMEIHIEHQSQRGCLQRGPSRNYNKHVMTGGVVSLRPTQYTTQHRVLVYWGIEY